MVINNAKQDFSGRLNALLDSIHFPTRGRQTRLSEYMTKLGHKVGQKGARKWLVGESIPSHEKIIALCNDTNANPMWLEYGSGKMFGTTPTLPPKDAVPGIHLSFTDSRKRTSKDEGSEVLKALASLPDDKQKLATDILMAVLGVLRSHR